MSEQPTKEQVCENYVRAMTDFALCREIPLPVRRFVRDFYDILHRKIGEDLDGVPMPPRRVLTGFQKVRVSKADPKAHVYEPGQWAEIYRIEEAATVPLEIKGVMVHEGQQYLQLIESSHFFHTDLVERVLVPPHFYMRDGKEIG